MPEGDPVVPINYAQKKALPDSLRASSLPKVAVPTVLDLDAIDAEIAKVSKLAGVNLDGKEIERYEHIRENYPDMIYRKRADIQEKKTRLAALKSSKVWDRKHTELIRRLRQCCRAGEHAAEPDADDAL